MIQKIKNQSIFGLLFSSLISGNKRTFVVTSVYTLYCFFFYIIFCIIVYKHTQIRSSYKRTRMRTTNIYAIICIFQGIWWTFSRSQIFNIVTLKTRYASVITGLNCDRNTAEEYECDFALTIQFPKYSLRYSLDFVFYKNLKIVLPPARRQYIRAN